MNVKYKNVLIGLVIIVIAGIIVYKYFQYADLYPDTDDAYVAANIVDVAPKTSGYLSSLVVHNNQLVHKGDLLFQLNSADYQFNLTQAQSNYASYLNQINILRRQIMVQQQALVKDKIQLTLAQQILHRYKILLDNQTLSKQSYQSSLSNVKLLQTAIDIDQNKLLQYTEGVTLLNTKRDGAEAAMKSAQSNVNNTAYYAPIDGYVSNLNAMTNGEYISIGQQMFSIVGNDHWWIDANFKETQIARIRPGQKVEIELDMYSHKYTGFVSSISYASGNSFSLLPAQNATGNWVKVTQRFTVRIMLHDEKLHPLRIGASCHVKIDTTSKDQ